MLANMPLDAFDRKIIAALQADGRLANVDLAEKIGLSPSPCLRRVKRLEREGYIGSPIARRSIARGSALASPSSSACASRAMPTTAPAASRTRCSPCPR